MKKKELKLRIQQEQETIRKLQEGSTTVSAHPLAYHEGRLSILSEMQEAQLLDYLNKKLQTSYRKEYQCPVCKTPCEVNNSFALEEYQCPRCGWTLTSI